MPERRDPPIVLAALLTIAAAIRVAVNNVAAYSPADETIYLQFTRALAGGERYATLVQSFIADPSVWVFPNPLRWSWLGATTLFCSIAGECSHRSLATLSTVAGIAAVALTWWIARELFDANVALLAATLAATSPLQLALGRRALADEFFCALVLASIAALVRYTESRSRAWLVAWVVLTTLTIAAKEQFLFLYPVVLLFWWLRAQRVSAIDVAAAALPPILFAAVFSVLARDVTSFFRIARIITSVMGAPYAEQYQSGPPHRIVIDFLAVAPIVTMIAIAAMVRVQSRAQRDVMILAAGIVLVHALLASKNLRYVVAADPFLRILAASFAIGVRRVPLAIGIAVNAAVELFLFHRIFIAAAVYDTVTDQLLRALRMLPR
jgi:Dolichyl-phosphate-mannose-protein mannosyltransferase